MKETVNFGFKKPESTDFVDVSVFGENFDKIDEALTPYRISTGKDHDFSYAAGEEDNISVLNLTELLGASAAEIIAAFDMGRPVVVSVADSANEFADVSVVLTQKTVYGTITSLSGMAANPLTEHYGTVMRFTLVLTLNEDGGYDVKLQIMDHAASGTGGGGGLPADFPVSVDENGYTQIEGLPRATNIDNVLDGDVLTVTSTLQDGRTVPGTMTFDANGMPESYTEEGVACKFSFTGFEKKVKTVELPAVELRMAVLSGEMLNDAENADLTACIGMPCVIKILSDALSMSAVSTYTKNGEEHSFSLGENVFYSTDGKTWNFEVRASG